MILTVLICSFVLDGIFGFPSLETPQENIEGRTFDFDWNPLNWFTDQSAEDPNDKKLAALFNTIECLVRKSPKECSKPLDDARLQFETDKNKSTTTTSTTSSSSAPSTTRSTTPTTTTTTTTSTTPSTTSTTSTTPSTTSTTASSTSSTTTTTTSTTSSTAATTATS